MSMRIFQSRACSGPHNQRVAPRSPQRRMTMARAFIHGLGLGLGLALLTLTASIPAVAAPCTAATTECISWASAGETTARLLTYTSYPLDKRNENVTRALVVVHGGGRNGDNYFRTGVAAAFLANALDDTIVIAPRFAANGGDCKDRLADNELNWPCTGLNWRIGGAAVNNAAL